jgi:GNAT superfamily N-acetyltransferase
MLSVSQITEEGKDLIACIQLFRAYAEELNADLCFQNFESELEHPLKKYGPPKGALFLAKEDDLPIGCVAFQPLSEEGCCEMKRLYVAPQWRKKGVAKLLIDPLLKTATKCGYTCMKLDTLDRLVPAIELYKSLGFIITQPYYSNPLHGVVYMEKQL